MIVWLVHLSPSCDCHCSWHAYLLIIQDRYRSNVSCGRRSSNQNNVDRKFSQVLLHHATAVGNFELEDGNEHDQLWPRFERIREPIWFNSLLNLLHNDIRRMDQKLRTETGKTRWNRLASYSQELENSFGRNFSTTSTVPTKKFRKRPWYFHQIKSNQTIFLFRFKYATNWTEETRVVRLSPFLFSLFTLYVYTLVLVVKDICFLFVVLKSRTC